MFLLYDRMKAALVSTEDLLQKHFKNLIDSKM